MLWVEKGGKQKTDFSWSFSFCLCNRVLYKFFFRSFILLLVDIMERIDYGIISLFKMELIIISFNTFLSLSLSIIGQLPVINFLLVIITMLHTALGEQERYMLMCEK